MSALSLDDDEPTPGLALSLDEDEPGEGHLVYTLRLFPDSPYAKVPAFLLAQRTYRTSEILDVEDHFFKVIDVVDFAAGTEANPGEAYRLIKVVET